MPAAKTDDKPKTTGSAAENGQTPAPPQGPVVSLMGINSYVWATLTDGTEIEFEVNAWLTARVGASMTDADGDGDGIDIAMWNTSAMIRVVLRDEHPDHPFGKLPMPEFMKKIVVPLKTRMLPDFGGMDPNDAGVMQDLHPFPGGG